MAWGLEDVGARWYKMQDEIEIIIILATASKFLINFDINSIVITASPRYFVSAQHVENELRSGLSREPRVPRVFITHSNNSRVMPRERARTHSPGYNP